MVDCLMDQKSLHTQNWLRKIIHRQKVIAKKILPKKSLNTIRVVLRFLSGGKLREYFIINKQLKLHGEALARVRDKDKINVVFFVIHASVWKYDHLYKLMDSSPRFEPTIVACPVVNFGRENMLAEMEKAFNQFRAKGYNVVRAYSEAEDSYLDVKNEIKPDLIFFTNPYKGLVDDRYYIDRYPDVLTCYVPYGFTQAHFVDVQYDLLFHNLLWRYFGETIMHKKMASEHSRRKGSNFYTTGYPGIDGLIYKGRHGNGAWKNSDITLKRIIWAPHHTIYDEDPLQYSNFILHSRVMLDLTKEYRDKIQIAFKPHPLLWVKLCEHSDWGRDRTDKYYQEWATLENGQLENGDYLDLFNSSDAMILDSGSFVAEYLYCGKPSLFVYRDEGLSSRFNRFGKLALQQHYRADGEADIRKFIDFVVCDGNDFMKTARDEFYFGCLMRINGKSASENIFSALENEFFS